MSSASAARICIVGAGPCGLTALKNVRAFGLDNVVCYDESDAIGGNWTFDESPDRTSVYETTHIISSKRLTEFEDFPMPAGYPDFPSHRQLRAYFESYADHFNLTQFIRLRTRVEKARRLDDGRWSVRTAGPEGNAENVFDHLIVCAGHHRDPYVPEYPGEFSGEILHSRDFKRADGFRDKRVLVVGAGNSACDIAVDIGRVAAHTCLSMRRGYYIVPKLIFGRPVDVMYARLRKHLGRGLVQRIASAAMRIIMGPWRTYGLQAPKNRLFETHPTLNSNILNALRHGTVLPRVGIERLDGATVHFRDGTAESFDTIVWCTGFNVSYPFLDNSIFNASRTQPQPLYLKMMHERIANLYFIGLFQPIGCIWRLADYQARIAASQIAGRLGRPADIAKRISKEMRSPHWNFKLAANQAPEVDYHDFRHELLEELKQPSADRETAASATRR